MATLLLADPTMSTRRPNDTHAWRAVETRDARYDGAFVYAVTSTRIYCRPSCPSRRPTRENVRFFTDPAVAEASGFRPCKRCDPRGERTSSAIEQAVERAKAHIDAQGDRAVSLAELARVAGLSPSHLQRTFKRIVGVSPREYQHAERVRRFKGRLRAGDTVSRATYEAGFGSSSRVYENADAMLGMTPAAYRRGGAGVRIAYTIGDTPVGRVLVGTTERGVCAVALGSTDDEVLSALRADFPNATIEPGDASRRAIVEAVLERVRHPRDIHREIPLDLSGTAFQREVWRALQAIPAGESRSYGDIAAAIGRPSATRAVARACATNRIAVVIPCHRVVRGDGALSGYKWGTDRKRHLLDGEAS